MLASSAVAACVMACGRDVQARAAGRLASGVLACSAPWRRQQPSSRGALTTLNWCMLCRALRARLLTCLPPCHCPPPQGRLYNKQTVLEWILARAGRFEGEAEVYAHMNRLREAGDQFEHIMSMK